MDSSRTLILLRLLNQEAKILTNKVKTWILTKEVSTWSSLGVAMNSKPKIKLNISLGKENHGLFGDPDLRNFDGFTSLKDKCLIDANKLVDEAVSNERNRKLIYIFDELSDTLCKVADLAEFIRVAHPAISYVYTAGLASSAVSSMVEKLNTNRVLYQTLHSVVERDDQQPMNEMEKHVSKLFLFDFEQSGIHLEDTERYKVVNLNESILKLGQKFATGVIKPRQVKSEFIPPKAKNAFRVDGTNIIVSSLYAENPSGLVREVAYRVFLHPDKEQEYVLSSLLKLRYDLAQTCGFSCYSERALKGSVFDKPDTVMEFLKILSNSIKLKATSDFSLMETIKKMAHPNEGPLAPWDVSYFTQKIKKDQFKIKKSEYTQYFSLGACMEGLNNLFKNLYGITLENSEILPGETWSPDVYKLDVHHDHEGLLGYIYCDFFERTGKPPQDSHFTIRGGKSLGDGLYQLPIVVIMLNLPQPGWSSPSLLSISMVENLFHEMGHAMHSMLGRTQFQHVTGTRCSTDFAEVPSILMEYFASDPRVIRSFAKHYRTEEPIPNDVLGRLCATKHLFLASGTQMQIFYSILDQIYHGEHPLQGSTTDVLRDTQNFYYHLPYVENTAWQLRFGHLVGYGAKYYSYLVSKAIASCIWQTYFEEEPFNRQNGENYRRNLLAHGGGKPPYQIIGDYLKTEVSPKFLADFLSKEIVAKTDRMETLIKLNKK